MHKSVSYSAGKPLNQKSMQEPNRGLAETEAEK